MRVLIIDDAARDRIAVVRRYAEQNFIGPEQMQEIKAGIRQPPGDDPGHRTFLKHGYRVVFSIEKQPMGWARHLSVSVDDPDRVPNFPAMDMIMQEFGFKGKCQENYFWLEKEITPHAVNVVELIDALEREIRCQDDGPADV